MNKENIGFHRGYKRGHDVGFAKGMLFGAIVIVGSAVVGVGIGVVINKFVK